jgi:hypothetical protein
MGDVFRIVNDDAKQMIDPQYVDNGSGKWGMSMPGSPFGSIVLYAMTTFWRGDSCRVMSDAEADVPDFVEGYDRSQAYYGYENVTEKMVSAYNSQWNTNYKYTPG